ncbi:hypothetical protein JL721_4279 [Aureococcus anophagefferens]|nr:hypothetical protein JL721_4279 [Aureococcus anophagefferens]
MGEHLTVDAAILRLRRMGEAEGAYAPAGPSPAASSSGCGGPSTRAKITHWFCQMGESFDLAGHTVGLAANFLDRCTARRDCGAAQYQLIAVTALLLAAKVEERKPITLNDLVVLSSGLFERDDIRLMELELLRALEWRLNAPTVHAFVDLLLRLVDDGREAPGRLADRVRAEAKAFVDLSVVHDEPALRRDAWPRPVMCGFRQAGCPVEDVELWTTRVKACGFAYGAADLLECGASFTDDDDDDDRDDDDSADEEIRMCIRDDDGAAPMDEDDDKHGCASSPHTVATDFFTGE